MYTNTNWIDLWVVLMLIYKPGVLTTNIIHFSSLQQSCLLQQAPPLPLPLPPFPRSASWMSEPLKTSHWHDPSWPDNGVLLIIHLRNYCCHKSCEIVCQWSLPTENVWDGMGRGVGSSGCVHVSVLSVCGEIKNIKKKRCSSLTITSLLTKSALSNVYAM